MICHSMFLSVVVSVYVYSVPLSCTLTFSIINPNSMNTVIYWWINYAFCSAFLFHSLTVYITICLSLSFIFEYVSIVYCVNWLFCVCDPVQSAETKKMFTVHWLWPHWIDSDRWTRISWWWANLQWDMPHFFFKDYFRMVHWTGNHSSRSGECRKEIIRMRWKMEQKKREKKSLRKFACMLFWQTSFRLWSIRKYKCGWTRRRWRRKKKPVIIEYGHDVFFLL